MRRAYPTVAAVASATRRRLPAIAELCARHNRRLLADDRPLAAPRLLSRGRSRQPSARPLRPSLPRRGAVASVVGLARPVAEACAGVGYAVVTLRSKVPDNARRDRAAQGAGASSRRSSRLRVWAAQLLRAAARAANTSDLCSPLDRCDQPPSHAWRLGDRGLAGATQRQMSNRDDGGVGRAARFGWQLAIHFRPLEVVALGCAVEHAPTGRGLSTDLAGAPDLVS